LNRVCNPLMIVFGIGKKISFYHKIRHYANITLILNRRPLETVFKDGLTTKAFILVSEVMKSIRTMQKRRTQLSETEKDISKI